MPRSSSLKTFERLGDLERVSDTLSEHVVHTDEQRRRPNAQPLSGLQLTDRQPAAVTLGLKLEVGIVISSSE